MSRNNFILAQILLTGLLVLWALFIFRNGFRYTILPQLMFLVLLSAIPQTSFTIRRLHDLNMSGLWFFVMFVPYLGFLFLIYLSVKKGNADVNVYGAPDTRPVLASILNKY